MNKEKKPNILLIVTDQQNMDTIAAYKNVLKNKAYHCHWVKTPNLDKIAENGYSFIESYSTDPVCSPARSSIFTGRYAIETGVITNGRPIDKNLPNLGQWLEQNSDYYRVYCGKWHLSSSYPEVEGPRKIAGFDILPVGMFTPPLTGDYIDFQVSGALSGYIRNYSEEKPFLAVAGLMNPHDICYWKGKLLPKDDHFNLKDDRPPIPPNSVVNFEKEFEGTEVHRLIFEKFNERFSEEEWRNYIFDYQRMIEKLDADIGRLLDAVESRNDDTLIIITSDHGEGSGRHRRTEKNSPYEEATKVPMIFYYPKVVKKNVYDRNNIVSGVDIVPTVCDYAGIPAPPDCRGESLRPIIEGKKTLKKRNLAITELKQTIRILRHGNYKYVRFYKSSSRSDLISGRTEPNAETIIPDRNSVKLEKTGLIMLFDIKNDPWETKNLAHEADSSEIIAKMDETLANEFESVVIPGAIDPRN